MVKSLSLLSDLKLGKKIITHFLQEPYSKVRSNCPKRPARSHGQELKQF